MSMTANDLADMIASIEHWRAGPDTLAGELLPLIERHIAAGHQGATNPAAEAIQYHNAVGPIDAMAAAFSAMDNSDTALEEWPQRAIDALAFAGWAVVPYALPYEVLGEAGISGVFETGNPKHGWDWLVAKTRIGPHGPPAATPQPPKPAGAVPKLKQYVPALVRINGAYVPSVEESNIGQLCYIDDAIQYAAAREAAARDAGRADAVPAQMADELMDWANHPLNGLTPMRIADLEAFADRLRAPQPMTTQGEDTARLDWLASDMAKEDEGVGIDCADGRFRFPWLDNGAGGSGGGVYHANYDSLREAIDAARLTGSQP